MCVCVCACAPTRGWSLWWCQRGRPAEPGSETCWRHRWLWQLTSASSDTLPTLSSAPGTDQSRSGPSLTNKCPGCLEARPLPGRHRGRHCTGHRPRLTPERRVKYSVYLSRFTVCLRLCLCVCTCSISSMASFTTPIWADRTTRTAALLSVEQTHKCAINKLIDLNIHQLQDEGTDV